MAGSFGLEKEMAILYGKVGLPPAIVTWCLRSILSQVPAGRFGNPSEIAEAIVFLASDESAFTVELVIGGGMINT